MVDVIVKRVALISIAMILLSMLFSFDVDCSNSPDIGAIRVRFHPFPYLNDPHGISYNSRGRLGELSAYVLRIYATKQMEMFAKLKLKRDNPPPGLEQIGTTFIPVPEEYGTAIVKEAKTLFNEPARDQVIALFAKGGRLEVIIPGSTVPPYIDIPAPTGTYYFEYSLLFLDAKNPKNTKVHPNYPSRSSNDSSVLWGPAKATVKSGMAANIDFRPTHNINFYHYPDFREGYFESTPGFWDWIEFLFWAGEVSR